MAVLNGSRSSLIFVFFIAEYRGQGVGLGLICAAILELKQRGMRACFVDWVDLEGTYEQLGIFHLSSQVLELY